MDARHKAEWRVLGKSVRGASHVRTGLPNQDAIGWLPESGSGPPLLLAIADGHGSAQHFRSAQGAQLAVTTAMTALQSLLDGQAEIANPEAIQHAAEAEVPQPGPGGRLPGGALRTIKRAAEERVPQRLVQAWLAAVAAHVAAHPFTDAEWARLVDQKGPEARRAVEEHPVLAYGTTLLTVLVTEAFILYLQLGDGDMLTVSEHGEVTRPLCHDERLMANETTSLCLPQAWNDFRVGFQELTAQPPPLILLSTDGYANSFADEAGFLQVGSDLLAMLRADGLEQVQASLEQWLTETSNVGSGDDITLGIISRVEEERVDASLPPEVSPASASASHADPQDDGDAEKNACRTLSGRCEPSQRSTSGSRSASPGCNGDASRPAAWLSPRWR